MSIVEKEVNWTQPDVITPWRRGDKIRVKCKYRRKGPFTVDQLVFCEVKVDKPVKEGTGCEVPHQEGEHKKDGVQLDISFEDTPVRVNWPTEFTEGLKVWVWLKNDPGVNPVIVQIDTFD